MIIPKKILKITAPMDRLDAVILYLEEYILNHKKDYTAWTRRHERSWPPNKPNTVILYELVYALRYGKYPEDII